jgi:uncharacterized protein (TIGR02246 family)
MKKNLISNILAMLSIWFIAGYPAISFSQETKEDEVRKRVQEYEDAYNRGDAEAVASIYDVNASHTYANGVTHRGRIEIQNGLEEMLSGPMKGTQMKLKPEVIRFPAENVAVEEASFIMTGLKMSDGKEVPPIKGFCLAVYHKLENEWFALCVQCMVPPPPPK